MRRIIALLLASTLIFALTACSGVTVESTDDAHVSQTANESGGEYKIAEYSSISVVYDKDDMDSIWNSSDMSTITLGGDSINLKGTGAIVEDSKITITSAGTYIISGTLDDGQIIVNTEDKQTVRLVLNEANITCLTSAPIYVINAEKTVITLADSTENHVTDGNSYILEDTESDEPNSAVFSKDDLTINGRGSLSVTANYNNGIQSKDGLKITGGNITVNAINDSIKGKDYVAIKGGNIVLNAGGDGIQSNNDQDSDKGFVAIDGGTINIIAGADGIQAENILMISSGDITIYSGGGSANAISKSNNMLDPRGNWDMETNNADDSDTSASTKGLKADIAITITGGTINIDSADDSIHSNDSLAINSGTITLASGDDGIRSESALEINGGDISITKCYEGIESKVITINEGDIHIVSSDDGINVLGGNDGFPMMGIPGQTGIPPGRQPGQNVNPPVNGQPDQLGNPPDRQPGQMGMPPGGQPEQDNFNASSDSYLYINGGYLAIDAMGDGLDINGSINMTGGVVIINGPTANNNGALDHVGFKMTGGFLVAVGSSGMAQAPSTSSTQYSVMFNFPSAQPADTMVHIETEDGEEILTFVPKKSYQSVVLCSPKLKNGSTYIVYSEGSSTGTVLDGLYSGGTYTAGTQNASFTISSIVTSAGSPMNTFPTGRPGGNMPPQDN